MIITKRVMNVINDYCRILHHCLLLLIMLFCYNEIASYFKTAMVIFGMSLIFFTRKLFHKSKTNCPVSRLSVQMIAGLH